MCHKNEKFNLPKSTSVMALREEFVHNTTREYFFKKLWESSQEFENVLC